MYQFLRIFSMQMADRLGRLLDPYPTAPSFVHFPSSNAPALAPLLLTQHRQRVDLLVWCNLPGEASTGPIFKRPKIINFSVSTYCCNRRSHRLIKMHSNETKNYHEIITKAYLHGGEARCCVFLVADGRLVNLRHPPLSSRTLV